MRIKDFAEPSFEGYTLGAPTPAAACRRRRSRRRPSRRPSRARRPSPSRARRRRRRPSPSPSPSPSPEPEPVAIAEPVVPGGAPGSHRAARLELTGRPEGRSVTPVRRFGCILAHPVRGLLAHRELPGGGDGPQRQRGDDGRASAGRRVHHERPVRELDPFAHRGETRPARSAGTRAPCRSRSPRPSSVTSTRSWPPVVSTATVTETGRRVLGRVRQRLLDDAVGEGLEVLRDLDARMARELGLDLVVASEPVDRLAERRDQTRAPPGAAGAARTSAGGGCRPPPRARRGPWRGCRDPRRAHRPSASAARPRATATRPRRPAPDRRAGRARCGCVRSRSPRWSGA